MNIGKNITHLREQRGLTIRDLAFKTDIAENSFSSIKHGKKGVGLMTLIKLADALNCSLDYLVGREASQSTTPIPFVSVGIDSHRGAFIGQCGYDWECGQVATIL